MWLDIVFGIFVTFSSFTEDGSDQTLTELHKCPDKGKVVKIPGCHLK